MLDEANDRSLALALSPEDLTLAMRLTVSRDGRLVFSRENRRLQSDRPVRFSMDLVAHPADWRAALDWMVRRYPTSFDPPNPAVQELAGCGAYSSHAEINTPGRLHRMAFRVNWKASFDFPFMAMFLPPTQSDTEEWSDFKHHKTSIAHMREHSQEMRRMGFHVLNYFNVTECGAYYKYPPPARKAAADADLWRDANDFLFYQVGEAILPGDDGKPIGSWEGCVGMDPGEPVYQAFLLEQARRHIEKLPESDGICIDRMDWLRRVNPRRDDGVTWIDGKPARSLAVSWGEISEQLGKMMHAAGKVIYVNPMFAHVGLLRHVDGIYDEFGDVPLSLNRSGLMGVRKPVMAWTRDAVAVRPAPDAYFQRHLHMGVYLTAPMPGNDHTILPAEDTDRYFLDYGPLLDALRGKRWVLRPHVIAVTGSKAKANLFEVPGGYVVPVTFGEGERATVVLRGLPRLDGQEGFRVEVIHPGQTEWKALKAADDGETLSLDVPLVRGCAIVKLACAWIDPKTTWFTGSTKVEMGTTLRDAVLRYTLDGSAPSAASTQYETPITLKQTTRIRAAAFHGEKQLGDVMTAEFVRLPADAPDFSPPGGGFDESLDVTIKPPSDAEKGEIHYTLDGTPPTAGSPRYTGPIRLTQTTKVRAAVFLPGCDASVGSAIFHGRGPKPPLPDVHLSDLTATRATTGWGNKPRMNRSIADKPLSLAGTTYARGIGVHAESEMEYDLKSDYRRFVATVGLDDAMKGHSEGSVVFEIWIDGRRVEETRILRAGDCGYINVAIPPGSKAIRLVVTDAIDGASCDHGDWANAGFVRHE